MRITAIKLTAEELTTLVVDSIQSDVDNIDATLATPDMKFFDAQGNPVEVATVVLCQTED